MPIIEFTQPFAWSERGWDVTQYAAGDITEVSDACAEAAAAADAGKPVDEAALQAAVEVHAKLLAAADKAEADADKAEAAAVTARAKAVIARQRAAAARVGRQAEADEAASDSTGSAEA